MRSRIIAIGLCAALASPALLAATPIDQTRPLDAHGRVEVENLKGRIQVRAWDRNEVRISGSLGEGVEKLVVEGSGAHLVVRVQYPKRMGGWNGDRTGPTDLQLQVPLQASLDLESVSADIDVEGVAPRELAVDTVSGDITIAAAPRSAEINSVSGDQRLTLNSADTRIESVSGDITLRGRLQGELHGETVSGQLAIDSRGSALRSVSISTVSGDTSARIALASGGDAKVESVSGDILLQLPRTLSARVSAETFSGSLSAPDAKVRKEEFGPGASLEHRYGSGAGEIRLETFSGDARLQLE
jgi:hypothetical protein